MEFGVCSWGTAEVGFGQRYVALVEGNGMPKGGGGWQVVVGGVGGTVMVVVVVEAAVVVVVEEGNS